MSTVIKIENLYKEYRLGVIGHGTLYRDLQSWWAKLKGKEDPNTLIGRSNSDRNKEEQILALDDINLEIKDGEALGIIGANGAGKSTLLKILSRVTAPTKGRIKIRGSIASLLEVGTGFHPELTGRENIYLNGAINGMNNIEVSRKLDEIVDFAGIEQFLDTPVKRYSSGMNVRLGFAVAVSLDPDILVVDEVLAVGDASFRKKAVNKMQDVSRSGGRTVLFVSHNMETIKNLCASAILLKQGQIIDSGHTQEVIDTYQGYATDDAKNYGGERTWKLDKAPGNDVVRLMAIRTKNEKVEACSDFDVTESFWLEVDYMVLIEGTQLAVAVEFQNNRNVVLFVAQDDYSYGPWGKQAPKKRGLNRASFHLPTDLLDTGTITLTVSIYRPPEPGNSYQLKALDIFSFNVSDSFSGLGARGNYPYHWGAPAVRPFIKCTSELVSN